MAVIDVDAERNAKELVDSFTIDLTNNLYQVGENVTVNKRGYFGIAKIHLMFRVLCAENYYGDRCEIFNPCSSDQDACSDHGLCTVERNSFVCTCDPGYTGNDCEILIMNNECVGVNCSGNGWCIN